MYLNDNKSLSESLSLRNEYEYHSIKYKHCYIKLKIITYHESQDTKHAHNLNLYPQFTFCLSAFPTIRNFSTHWRMWLSPQWGSIWSGSGSRRNTKSSMAESAGNASAVVRLPAPAAGAVSRTLKSPVTAEPETHVQDNNCESLHHLHSVLFTKGSHLSSVRHILLILQPAVSGCVLLT